MTSILSSWVVVLAAAAVAVMFAILFLAENLLMGSEGRFHLGRSMNRAGIDLLKYNPMSKALESTWIKFDGKYWREKGKKGNGIWLRLQQIANPDSEDEMQFNQAVSSSVQWKGSRRPVLLATEELCLTLNFDTLASITKGRERGGFLKNILGFLAPKKGVPSITQADIKQMESELQEAIKGTDQKRIGVLSERLIKARERFKQQPNGKVEKSGEDDVDAIILNRLRSMAEVGVTQVRIVQPIDINDLNNFIQGASPIEMEEVFEEGKTEGILLMTNPTKPSKPTNWLLIGILLAVLILGGVGIAWLISSGTLQNMLPG